MTGSIGPGPTATGVLDTWQDLSKPWAEHGIEHAAEVVAWGLMDEGPFFTSIGMTAPLELAEAFVLLTGREPLTGT